MKNGDAALDAAFDAAFDEAVTGTPAPASGNEGVVTPPAGDEPPAPAPASAGDEPPAPAPAGDEPPAPAPAGDPLAGGAPAPEPPPAPAPAGPTEAERIAALEAQLAEANRKLAAAPTVPVAPAAPAAPAPPAEPEPPKLTEEEQAELDEFTANWPAHSKALALQNKLLQKQVEQLVAKGLQGVVGQLTEKIAPIIEKVQKAENKTFRETVLEKHNDLDTIRPKLQTWVEKQPTYLRKAYEETLRAAPAEDVIDLITRFKKEEGLDRPQVTTPSTPPAATPAAPDPNQQRRLDRMEAVDGGASKPSSSGADPLDFDGAFDEAANRLTK